MAGANKSLVVEDVTETVEKVIENNVDSSVQPDRTERLLKFPLTRIKTIIKTDSDVNLASSDAVVLIAKATVNIEHRWALVKCGLADRRRVICGPQSPVHARILIMYGCQ